MSEWHKKIQTFSSILDIANGMEERKNEEREKKIN